MYETELMREILKSPMAQKMVQQISHRYGKAYVFLWLMQVTGMEWDDLSKWVEEIKLQIVPQTATWSLEYWERQYRITPDPSWSDDQRRQNIMRKRTGRTPANPAKIKRVVESITGLPARIVENTGKNHFTIYISGFPEDIDENAVRTTLRKIIPARLIFTIAFEAFTKSQTYTAGSISVLKKIDLQQL